jgi:hypothetical protein
LRTRWSENRGRSKNHRSIFVRQINRSVPSVVRSPLRLRTLYSSSVLVFSSARFSSRFGFRRPRPTRTVCVPNSNLTHLRQILHRRAAPRLRLGGVHEQLTCWIPCIQLPSQVQQGEANRFVQVRSGLRRVFGPRSGPLSKKFKAMPERRSLEPQPLGTTTACSRLQTGHERASLRSPPRSWLSPSWRGRLQPPRTPTA